MNNPLANTDESIASAQRLAAGLYTHQVAGVAFLLGRQRAILADDMGLGKTRQSILALRESAPRGPYLVVCPATVKNNWQREIQLVLGEGADVVIVGGKIKPPHDAFDGWIVINYDILKKHLDHLQELPLAGMVFDEAHYLKNYRSQRSKSAKQLVTNAAPGTVLHCLTGTPLTNRPRDLFPLLQLVNHPLGNSFLAFAKRYCDAFRNDYGWVTDGASNIEELTVQLHGTMLRRRKEEVLDLPGKLRSWLTVDVPETPWRQEVRKLLRALIARREPDSEQKGDIGVLARLAPARKRIAIAKVKQTIEFVEGIVEQGQKVVVYSCFTDPVTQIRRHFGDAARELTGKTPQSQRQPIIDEFQHDDSVHVLAANIIAGGVGVNLTSAQSVVFNDLDWVPANHWQAEDRAYRIGQSRTVNVYYFSARDTLDDFVASLLETKAGLVSAIVDGGAVSAPGAATADVLSELRAMIDEFEPQATSLEDDDQVDAFLRDAVKRYRQQQTIPRASSNSEGKPTVEHDSALRTEAVRALAAALGRPPARRFQLAGSRADSKYLLEVDGTDVTCNCRGFEYRGQCKHAAELKEAITGGEVPAHFKELDEQ